MYENAQSGRPILMPKTFSTKVNMKMVKSMIPIMLRTPPAVTISFMVTYSVPYATAFGGVATGSMNARDEATATVIIISIGFTARAVTEIPARTGIMMFATAVFEVNSVKIITTIARMRTKSTIGIHILDYLQLEE